MIKKKAALHCLALNLPEAVELSVVLCDDPIIQQLNAQWRDEDTPTDVLSFPMVEDMDDLMPGMPLGDIIISVEYAERLVGQHTHRDRVAEELGVDPMTLTWGLAQEVEFLMIHGLLHLVGHDHLEPEDEVEMKAEERRLWLAGQAPA